MKSSLSVHDPKLVRDIRKFLSQYYPTINIDDNTLGDALSIVHAADYLHSLNTQIIEPPVRKGIANITVCKFLRNRIEHSKNGKKKRTGKLCKQLKNDLQAFNKTKLRKKFSNRAQELIPKHCGGSNHDRNNQGLKNACRQKYFEYNRKYTLFMDKC